MPADAPVWYDTWVMRVRVPPCPPFGSDRTIRDVRGWTPLRAKAPRRRVRFPHVPAIW